MDIVCARDGEGLCFCASVDNQCELLGTAAAPPPGAPLCCQRLLFPHLTTSRISHRAPNKQGFAADVARPGQARLLADFACSELGRVDLWINNAGTNGYRYGPMAESTDEELQQIVGTNVLGVMLCCKEVGGSEVGGGNK